MDSSSDSSEKRKTEEADTLVRLAGDGVAAPEAPEQTPPDAVARSTEVSSPQRHLEPLLLAEAIARARVDEPIFRFDERCVAIEREASLVDIGRLDLRRQPAAAKRPAPRDQRVEGEFGHGDQRTAGYCVHDVARIEHFTVREADPRARAPLRRGRPVDLEFRTPGPRLRQVREHA